MTDVAAAVSRYCLVTYYASCDAALQPAVSVCRLRNICSQQKTSKGCDLEYSGSLKMNLKLWFLLPSLFICKIRLIEDTFTLTNNILPVAKMF